jgi:MscS family membrane protein
MKRNVFLLAVTFLLLRVEILAQPTPQNSVDPQRQSAAATLRTFFEAFRKPRVGVGPDPLEEAVRCLDLSGIPPELRSIKGLEATLQIKEALELVANFQIEDAPADPNAEPFVAYRSTQSEIIIARQPNGEWLFTKETVRSIPVLIARIQDEKLKNGSVTLLHEESLGAQIRDRMPGVLKQKTLLLEGWQWLGLGILLLAAWVVGRILRFISDRTFGKYLRKRYVTFTGEQIRRINAPVALLTGTLAFRLLLPALALQQSVLTSLRTALFILTAIAVIWFLYRITDIFGFHFRQRSITSDSQLNDLLVPYITTMIRLAIMIIGAIILAENLDFDVTGLIAGLGIGGIAIALASQETLSNFFGSLVLLIEQPFRAEDRVEIDKVRGIVKEIGLRSTKIFTYDDSLVTLPNSTIAKSAILNDGIKRQRRWVLKLSLPYQEYAKIEKFCRGIREIIEHDANLDEKPFKLHLFDLTPPSIILRVEVYFKADNWAFELDARHAFIAQLLKLSDDLELKLEIPN